MKGMNKIFQNFTLYNILQKRTVTQKYKRTAEVHQYKSEAAVKAVKTLLLVLS